MSPNIRKIAVVLSGCGFQEGAEITESVSTLIALSQAGAEVQVFSPLSVLNESAKIARGNVRDLAELKEADFDGVAFPGGFGAAKVLSDWASKGSKATVLPDVQRVILEFHGASKPIAAFCIAPTLVAKVLGPRGVSVTIGNDSETAQEIEKTGAQHEDCAVDDFITDRAHKVITSPAYMYDDATPSQVFAGISKAVKELVEMA